MEEDAEQENGEDAALIGGDGVHEEECAYDGVDCPDVVLED